MRVDYERIEQHIGSGTCRCPACGKVGKCFRVTIEHGKNKGKVRLRFTHREDQENVGGSVVVTNRIACHLWESSDTAVEYRDVVGFPGYRVGNDGSVWSRRTNMGVTKLYWRRMRTRVDEDGYLRVSLRRGNKSHGCFVAHLVLEAFVGPRPEGAMSLHFPDPTRTNNRPENLRWGTVKDNSDDKEAMGNTPKGETHGSAKLTTAKVLEMRRLYATGMRPLDLSRMFGVTDATVSKITKRRTWKHV